MNPRAFGLATAAVYGGFMALLAWFGVAYRPMRRAVDLTAEYYPGYRATWSGGLIGALYGLATGYAMGWLTAWVYNRLRTQPFASEMEPSAAMRVEQGAGI